MPLPRRRLSFHEETIFYEKARDPLAHTAYRRKRLAEQLLTRQQHLRGSWDQLQQAIDQEQADAHACGKRALSNAERRLVEMPVAVAISLIQAPKTARSWRWQPFYSQTLPAIVALRGHELAMRLLPELSLMWAAMHDALEGGASCLSTDLLPEFWRSEGPLCEDYHSVEQVMQDLGMELAQQDPEQGASWGQERLLSEALGILQAQHVVRLGPAAAKIAAAAKNGPLTPDGQLSTTLLHLARVAIEERSTGLAREVLGALSGDARCLPLSLGTGSGMASGSYQGRALVHGPVILRRSPVLEEEQQIELRKLWRSLIQNAAPSHQPAYDDAASTGRCLSLAYWVSEMALERAAVFEALADLEGADQSVLLDLGPHWVATGEGMRESRATSKQRGQWWREAQDYLKRQFQNRGATLLHELAQSAWPGSSVAQLVLHHVESNLDRIAIADALSGLEHAEQVIRSSSHRAQLEGNWQAVREWAALWVSAEKFTLDELHERIEELLPALSRDCEQAFRELGPRLERIKRRLASEHRLSRQDTRLSISSLMEETRDWELRCAVEGLERSWQALSAEDLDPKEPQESLETILLVLRGLMEGECVSGSARRSRHNGTLEALQTWIGHAKQLRGFWPVEPLPEAQRREVQRLAKGIELEAIQRIYGPWAAASQLSQEVLIEQTSQRHAPIWSLMEREEFAMAIVERAQQAEDAAFVGAVCRNLIRGRPWAKAGRRHEEEHRCFAVSSGQGLRCRGRTWHPQDLSEQGSWLQEQCRLHLQQQMNLLSRRHRLERRHPEVVAVARLLKLAREGWPPAQSESFLQQTAPYLALHPDPIVAALNRANENELARRIQVAIAAYR
jgi:hypothetical protein